VLYAAYGSNLHPTRLAQRIHSARQIGTGFVPGWSLSCYKRSKDGSAKFNIVAGGNGVYVAVFDINADDKMNLDEIEGVGSGYRTVDLSVPQIGDCATYVAEDSYVDESLRPYEWYKKLTTLGARAQCFPDAYVRLIDQIPAGQDPDKARHATNWRIVEAIESSSRPDALR
jgi:gamma-glutamylcyclotransferase